MMKNTLKSYNSDNRGSAIITGLVVSTVLMVLCLSLLLVAYSLFISTAKSTSDLPNREMLYSAAEALEHELLDFSVIYEDGVCKTDISGHKFWEYIDTNIWKGFDENTGDQDATGTEWLYYNKSDSSTDHGNLEKCSKYFNMTSIGSVKIVVQLYWELPKGYFDDTEKSKNGTLLNAIYRMYDNKGNLLVKADRTYKLTIDSETSLSDSGSGSSEGNAGNNSSSTSFTPIVDDREQLIYGEPGGLMLKFQRRGSSDSRLYIINDTESDIDGWKLYFYSDENVKANDSRYLNKIGDGVYAIQNMAYEGKIKSKERFTIYFYSNFLYYPNAVLVEDLMQPIPSNQYKCEYKALNNYSGEFEIINNTGKKINGWELEFDFDGTINNAPQCVGPIVPDGNHYKLVNVNEYKEIEAGATFNLLVYTNDVGVVPTNVVFKTYNLNTLEDINNTSSIVKTTIKWNRIGEEIVNPGGGN